MFIIKPDSSRAGSPRQRCSTSAWGRRAALLTLVLALALGGAGCRSIYHRSGEVYPADSAAQVALRLDQARQAGKEADQAAARLRNRAAKGAPAQSLETDIDRLEMAAREFTRRVTILSETSTGSPQAERVATETRNLQKRSQELLEGVQCLRAEGLAAALPRLDQYIQNPHPR